MLSRTSQYNLVRSLKHTIVDQNKIYNFELTMI